MYRKILKFFFISIILTTITLFIYLKLNKNEEANLLNEDKGKEIYNSNLIQDVEYSTKDKDGNEYFIKAKEGEIDFSNSNIIFLKKVYALIKFINKEEVTIVSDFGKYNSENFDTIFSKAVKINYLDNKITGEYLDFSLERNTMIVSKNVIYSNMGNILKADVVEMNIKTKDTKIYMLDEHKKVNIQSKL